MKIDESVPSERPMPEGAFLAVWVIYERPKDHPQGYVLRCQWVMKDKTIKLDHIAWYAKDADDLRSIVPPGLVRIGHQSNEDPCILETWI